MEVSMMIGIEAVLGDFLSLLITSIPFIPGIILSIFRISGIRSATRSKTCEPSFAHSTSNPSASSIVLTICTMSACHPLPARTFFSLPSLDLRFLTGLLSFLRKPPGVKGGAVQNKFAFDRHRAENRLHDIASVLGVADTRGDALGRFPGFHFEAGFKSQAARLHRLGQD